MMARPRFSHYFNVFSNHFVGNVKASFFILLLLSQIIAENDRYFVTAISYRSSSTSSAKADKFGAYMERQPESTIAPLYDEVVFECGLNLVSDRIEWRFRPLKARTNNVNGYTEYTYLNETVRISKNIKESHAINKVLIVNETRIRCSFMSLIY